MADYRPTCSDKSTCTWTALTALLNAHCTAGSDYHVIWVIETLCLALSQASVIFICDQGIRLYNVMSVWFTIM